MGLSGCPLGIAISRDTSEVITLTAGFALFLLGYILVFLGVEFHYNCVIAGVLLLGVSATCISISVLMRCLRLFPDHWGIVSGSLIGAGYGSTLIFHVWERTVINPANITPTGSGDFIWFYESDHVLDRCAEFFWILAVFLAVLLSFPLIVYHVYPDTVVMTPGTVTMETRACVQYIRDVTDSRFILTFLSFLFGSVAGTSARSALKSRVFTADERFLSSVGGSGAFAGAVGSVAMGIILDLASTKSVTLRGSQLLLLNCIFGCGACVMMIFAHSQGRVWFLFCYDAILFTDGGSAVVVAMVILDVCGVEQFPVSFGIASLSTFGSGIWYSLFSAMSWCEFWIVCAVFSLIAVVCAVGLQCCVLMREDEDSSDEAEFIMHQGKKYMLQR